MCLKVNMKSVASLCELCSLKNEVGVSAKNIDPGQLLLCQVKFMDPELYIHRLTYSQVRVASKTGEQLVTGSILRFPNVFPRTDDS